MDGSGDQPASSKVLGPSSFKISIIPLVLLIIASLSCVDLVSYISKNSVIIMAEINAVAEALQAPMAHFEDLREHLGVMSKNLQNTT
jgi:hypothetical protein